MVCPNCKHPVEDQAIFCPHCDYNFPNYQKPAVKSRQKTNKKPNQALWTFVIFAIVFLLVIPIKKKLFPENETKIQATNTTTTQEKFEPLQINENLTVTDFSTDRNLLSVTVSGTIKNTGDKDFSFVSISFGFYDSNGNKIDDKSDSITTLNSGETWKFEVTGPAEADRAEVSGFNAF